MIDFTQSKQYTLSIRLCTDGFSFSIYNPMRSDALSVVDKEIDPSLSITANLKRVCQEVDFVGHAYRKVHVMMASRRFTVVPLEWFDEKQAELLFYHNHPKQENEVVLCNVLEKCQLAVLFGMDKSAHAFLKEMYPEAHFCAQAAPLIDYFSVKSRLGNSRKMYASVGKETMDLYCFERGRLLLANAFECHLTSDRLYYLLFAWKQLKFDQERDELHLAGRLPEKEELTHELKKFIAQVFILNPAANMDIQALLTCE